MSKIEKFTVNPNRCFMYFVEASKPKWIVAIESIDKKIKSFVTHTEDEAKSIMNQYRGVA